MTTDPEPFDPAAVADRLRSASARAPRPLLGPAMTGISPELRDELAAMIDAADEIAWAREIPSRFTDARLDDLDPNLIGTLSSWAVGGGGENLVLTGPVGVGKTHAAVAAARARFDNYHDSVGFVPAVELFDRLRRPDTGGEVFDWAVSVGLLVVDDIGTQRDTDWTTERFYALVNRRWLEERPIIATTNLTGAALRESIGEHVYSRLVYAARVVALGGDDRRRSR